MSTPTTAQHHDGGHIHGHILTTVELPDELGGQPRPARVVVMGGSKEGLGIERGEDGQWRLWHLPSGTLLLSVPCRGISALLSAIGRHVPFETDWRVGRADLFANSAAMHSLALIRAWFGDWVSGTAEPRP